MLAQRYVLNILITEKYLSHVAELAEKVTAICIILHRCGYTSLFRCCLMFS